MTFTGRYRSVLVKIAKILVFSGAVLGVTKLTVGLGALANTSTASFSFLIIVFLSAYFGDLIVAITTSLVAAFCFDYFYLPPVGRFNIAAFSDWISLATFLLASVIISRLAAEAAENKVKAHALDKTLAQIKKFGEWLTVMPTDQLTLSGIAKETLTIFSLKYCSIHVYGEGKWQHYTGSAATAVSQEIENRLKIFQDHPSNLMELVDENMSGVHYALIHQGVTTQAMLVVKSKTLSPDAIGTIASLIGVRLGKIMKE